MRQRGKSFLNFDICYIRHLLRFYPFFFTNTVKICLLKKLLLVSIFKIQCNEYFCLQNYEKTVRNKHIKTHIVLLADFCVQNCEFPMIQIKTYFYHFDLLSFEPLSHFWPFVVWPSVVWPFVVWPCVVWPFVG